MQQRWSWGQQAAQQGLRRALASQAGSAASRSSLQLTHALGGRLLLLRAPSLLLGAPLLPPDPLPLGPSAPSAKTAAQHSSQPLQRPAQHLPHKLHQQKRLLQRHSRAAALRQCQAWRSAGVAPPPALRGTPRPGCSCPSRAG